MSDKVERFLRFFDLQEKQIADNRTQLQNLIKNEGFPPGIMLGPNTRAWPESEVAAWLASRPVAGPGEWRGIPKAEREARRRQADADAKAELIAAKQREAV